MISTHEIWELEPGVFFTILEPCSVAVLPHVLAPDPASVVWVVDHWPIAAVAWRDLPVPLTATSPCEPLRVRHVQFDFQMSAGEFLDRIVPRLPSSDGMILLQLERPVPDTLLYRDIATLPNKHAILRQNGWRLTFMLPHGGEYAEVTSPDRAELERILATPLVAAGRSGGKLP